MYLKTKTKTKQNKTHPTIETKNEQILWNNINKAILSEYYIVD